MFFQGLWLPFSLGGLFFSPKPGLYHSFYPSCSETPKGVFSLMFGCGTCYKSLPLGYGFLSAIRLPLIFLRVLSGDFLLPVSPVSGGLGKLFLPISVGVSGFSLAPCICFTKLLSCNFCSHICKPTRWMFRPMLMLASVTRCSWLLFELGFYLGCFFFIYRYVFRICINLFFFFKHKHLIHYKWFQELYELAKQIAKPPFYLGRMTLIRTSVIQFCENISHFFPTGVNKDKDVKRSLRPTCGFEKGMQHIIF